MWRGRQHACACLLFAYRVRSLACTHTTLLFALGSCLPLASPSSQEYAVALAARPAEMAKMRQLLREHRSKSPLFNTKAWTQGLVSFCLCVCLSVCRHKQKRGGCKGVWCVCVCVCARARVCSRERARLSLPPSLSLCACVCARVRECVACVRVGQVGCLEQ